ncbi:uncharacterized protein (TIGR03083 family) [Actinoplanes campanulatus]|uniref:Uncharacterized protein (TIGR03083 family) n=1 Tax=Actinoplanes campanulatus TaxID=113559 RepID=A0A7W5ARH5_9ACTN|nr:maleylpyruvate isomerase family mycothiol-dependent enzyme [Actinoplanes campanulatus]MBB3100950.1 uncharacterized protein (TIGR03083 family) [Actinoplanes campanulatus]GGN48919.1 hypothetical protein GCM10010109_86430 [Actinoplanes campanulatus]GID41769.1 hypothetical protein Aca09nite_82750 [Actinoplanes campanulatus]
MDYLALLHDEFAAYRACLDGDLTAPVEHCGDWTLRDLTVHLGQGNLWAATAITELRGDYQPEPPPEDLGAWFEGTARTLEKALERDPAAEAWTFAPPRTVAFWRRRRCLETLVHRWDAEHALGRPAELGAELCGDGIAEVIEVFVPRMIKRGLAVEPQAAVRFTATDLGGSWVLGPGEPVATLTGTAQELMLALWNRRPLPWETVTGDEAAARAALTGPLVP